MLYALARPLLFALDPERAHELTLGLADAPLRLGLLRVPRVPGAPVRALGLDFPNAVGLAAGLDKNAEHVDALARLGFGFLEVGTVTPRPQPGNPRPRLFRLPAAQALINRMGFNSAGLDAFMDNLGRASWRGILGVNIGKNADTPLERAADDYAACLERVYARASYVTVNVSSPNTRNLRDLQGAESLDALLGRLAALRERLAERHGRRVPLALKVAPELDNAQVQAIADAVEEALRAQKQRPSLVEGYARAEWILLDYFDFVVHVFSKQARDFYGLDRLWGSATRIEYPDVA